MSSDVVTTEDETLEIEQEGRARDKKASLNRMPSKTQRGLHEPLVKAPEVTPVAPTEFVPVKRLDTDQPPDDEGWKVSQDREKAEKVEEEKIIARMGETEQLGLDAGRCAEQVKKLRGNVRMTEKSLNTYKQKLVDAEALLMARLEELRRVEL